jgi:hypothetical protein
MNHHQRIRRIAVSLAGLADRALAAHRRPALSAA